MGRYLWIALYVSIGLLTLLGCRKAARPTTVAPVAPTSNDTVNPADDRHTSFATWWDSLSVEEREQFNKLPSDERSKKIREITGK